MDLLERGKPLSPLACLLLLLIPGTAQSQVVVRGPYLQSGTSAGILVRWRTDIATDSVVRYGTAPGSLSLSKAAGTATREHEIALTSLAPDTRYFYSIGTTQDTLAGGDDTHFFVSSPAAGSAKPTRVWVIGDSGTANSRARAVRDAFAEFTGPRRPDLWLMLGDNAYDDGTDGEYQEAVFDMYPQFLRNTVLWPTLGNHDGRSADSASESGPYFNIFSLPRNGEAGGVPSGTEAYYSFNYGNIHFVCLESHQSDRSPGGAMLTWLEADLQVHDKQWLITFWHHPPYSKGSHDSDVEGRLVDMRENVVPLLEQYGVDLVLTGHSHSYERSYFIDGHYGTSSSFSAAHMVDSGDGRELGDGAYQKPPLAAAPHQGAVYAVAGSSGKTEGGPLNHPAMVISVNSLGSMILDIDGGRLDATFLDDDGDKLDDFTIVKGGDSTPPQISSVSARDDPTAVVVGFSEPVERTSATAASNYAIDHSVAVSAVALAADARSVTLSVTPPLNLGIVYALTVSNVTDLSGNPIGPGTEVRFEYFEVVTESFQDGVAPDAGYDQTTDTYLSEVSPTANLGLSAEVLVDGDSEGTGLELAGLLRWDVSRIPRGSIIESARITVDVRNSTQDPYHCHALKRAWVESEATWEAAATGNGWEVAGARGPTDRDPSVICTVTATSRGRHDIALNSDGVALVQSWVDNPAANHGIVIANNSVTDGLDFASRENGTISDNPRLEVQWLSGGAPSPSSRPLPPRSRTAAASRP